MQITDHVMTSTDSVHVAHCRPDGRWELSWLPGRVLTRNEAITGMVLAETVGAGLEVNDRRWPALEEWARELGLSGPEAVVRVTTSDTVRAHIADAEAEAAAGGERIENVFSGEEDVAQPGDWTRLGDGSIAWVGPDGYADLAQEPVPESWRDGPFGDWTRREGDQIVFHDFFPGSYEADMYLGELAESQAAVQDEAGALHDTSAAEVRDGAVRRLEELAARAGDGSRTRVSGAIQAHKIRQEMERHGLAAEAARAQQIATDLTTAAIRDGVSPELFRFAYGVHDSTRHGMDSAELSPSLPSETAQHAQHAQDVRQAAALAAARDDAVPMTDLDETSAAGVVWSRRVDAAVHGYDEVAPAGLDVWMSEHAASAEPHLHEAELVAAWETRGTASGQVWDERLGQHEASSVDSVTGVGDDSGTEVSR